MKTFVNRLFISAILVILPQLVNAQWSLVRFDETNFFNKVEATSANSAIVAGMDGSGTGSFILKTNDGGVTWDSIVINSPGISYSLGELNFTDSSSGYAGGIKNNYQALLKTTDSGTTWTEVTPDPASINGISSISFIDASNGFSSDGYNLYKTTDGGLSWTASVFNYTINDLLFADMDNGYAFGNSLTDAVVIKTSDGGVTWTPVLSATFPFFTNSMQKADAVTPDLVYCFGQYTDKLFRTQNGGISWDTIQIPLIYSIQDFDFVNALEGHLLTSMGEIFGTTDGGLTWTLEYSVASGAYGPLIYLVSISFWGTTGYVCGSDGLIKKYATPTTIPEVNFSAISLSPNPVLSGSLLNIKNIKSGTLIEFYNLTGQLIYSQTKNFNNNEIICDFAAGVYSVVIHSESNRSIQKLIVVE